MRRTGGRHELKHYISQADKWQLQAGLRFVAALDQNGTNGTYRVRSLYFDNFNDKALREKIDGVDEREKFRLRFYNDDPSFLRLEKKSKRGGLCFKETVRITMEQCRSILGGHWQELGQAQSGLLLELYTKMQVQQLRPKSIVDYHREAYIYPVGNVRVTIDSDIRAGSSTEQFLEPQIVTIPLTGVNILEVKYDCFLPELIRGMVSLPNRRATAFSKYASTRFI